MKINQHSKETSTEMFPRTALSTNTAILLPKQLLPWPSPITATVALICNEKKVHLHTRKETSQFISVKVFFFRVYEKFLVFLYFARLYGSIVCEEDNIQNEWEINTVQGKR